MIAERSKPDHEIMNCMEVWGGNNAEEQHLTRPGLDVWIWSQSQACSAAGGSDLHLISSCASGRITRILLADVCGNGPAFDEISDSLRNLMRRNINTIQQSSFVRDMSHGLEGAAQRGGFASALISTFFAPTRSFSLCNAGHPPPLLFRNQTREWSVLKQTPADLAFGDVPLGVVDRDEYQQFDERLAIGDMVLSYGNILTECRGSSGRILGVEGLLNRVRQLDPQQPADLVSRLISQIRAEHADNLNTDDATAVLCRATDTKVAWRDNLLAPFRLLRSAGDKTRIS